MRTAVIGDGGWGTALAMVLARNGHEVSVWGPFPEYIEEVREVGENRKFLPGVRLPTKLTWTARPEEAVDGAEVTVLASPSSFYVSVLERFVSFIPEASHVVSVTKGLSKDGHLRMSGIAEELLGRGPVAALSGPSHAEEVARGVPSAVAVACEDHAIAEKLQAVFSSAAFRVYSSDDIIGVELGGALKNVIAIAAGVSDGIGYGDNTKAALITRGLAEMTRLGTALGAKPETFAGLSGIGDLIVTCASKLSRNRRVGEQLGKGESMEQILGNMDQVAEGVWTSSSAWRLAHDESVDVPITDEVHAIVHEGKDPREAVRSLLARDPKPETR